MNSKFDCLKKVEHKPNQIGMEKAYASHSNDNTTKQEFANTSRGSQKALAPKPQQQQQQQQIEESVSLKKNESNHHQQDQHHELEQEKKEPVYPSKHSLDKNNPPQTSVLNQVSVA